VPGFGLGFGQVEVTREHRFVLRGYIRLYGGLRVCGFFCSLTVDPRFTI